MCIYYIQILHNGVNSKNLLREESYDQLNEVLPTIGQQYIEIYKAILNDRDNLVEYVMNHGQLHW